VIDLMEALERSVNAAKRARGPKAHQAIEREASRLVREAGKLEDAAADEDDADGARQATRKRTPRKRTTSSRAKRPTKKKQPAKKATSRRKSA